MKRNIKIIFTLILAIILLVFTLTACSNTKPTELTAEQKSFYSSWMSYIDGKTPINRIAILGSHDSGISTTTSVIKGITKTQDLTIGKQLEYGCRYFDIRVNKKKNGDLTIFHSIDTTGENFIDITKDILQFIKTNTTEFLVLDFQHFKGESQKAVINVLNDSGIVDYAVKNTTNMSDLDFITSLKLEDVRGKFIIIWGSNEANGNTYPYLFRRNNDSCSIENACLDSLYSTEDNSKASAKFIEETIPKYFNHILNKDKGLTVLQAQLTSPSLGNVKKLEEGHNEGMSKYIRSIEKKAEYLTAVNIIMRDFIGSDLEKTNSILHLNIAKNNVKIDCISFFNKMTK